MHMVWSGPRLAERSDRRCPGSFPFHPHRPHTHRCASSPRHLHLHHLHSGSILSISISISRITVSVRHHENLYYSQNPSSPGLWTSACCSRCYFRRKDTPFDFANRYHPPFCFILGSWITWLCLLLLFSFCNWLSLSRFCLRSYLTNSLCDTLSLQQYLNLGIKHRVPEELCTRKTRNGDSLKMHYRYRSLKHISRAPPLSPLPFILFTNLSILKDINNMIVLAHILIVAAHSGPTAKSSTPLTIGISFDNHD